MSETLQKAISLATSRLATLSDSPRLEAELLLAYALGKDRSYLYTWPEQQLESLTEQRFNQLISRRLQGTPLAYILGTREFWSLDLQVTPDVLIPRADTEVLVEHALRRIPVDQHTSVLDLGTGSGAIALAIASERPLATITAIDQSEAALRLAEANARQHGLGNIHFLLSHWYQELEHGTQFDVIVTNPPYICHDDPHLEQGDLPHEPRSALASGIDGLDDIRIILAGLKDHLRPCGWILIEHGHDQGKAVARLMAETGLTNIECFSDLQGLDRVSAGQLGE